MSQKKILVVDDDLRLRDLLTRYLGEQGFAVKGAENGAVMDKLLLREPYDLIVLDLMMPGEDGLSICRRLRAAEPGQAIIMLTAKGDEIDRIVGLEMGADDYLPKPFNPRELLARIQAVLRRRGTATPGAPASEEGTVAFANIDHIIPTERIEVVVQRTVPDPHAGRELSVVAGIIVRARGEPE